MTSISFNSTSKSTRERISSIVESSGPAPKIISAIRPRVRPHLFRWSMGEAAPVRSRGREPKNFRSSLLCNNRSGFAFRFSGYKLPSNPSSVLNPRSVRYSRSQCAAGALTDSRGFPIEMPKPPGMFDAGRRMLILITDLQRLIFDFGKTVPLNPIRLNYSKPLLRTGVFQSSRVGLDRVCGWKAASQMPCCRKPKVGMTKMSPFL
jgi:hypothetical protein